MSTLKVDKLDPSSGTALEIGSAGDTMTVPSGAQLTIASGATIDVSGCTLTPPATMPASSGVNLTALNATQLTSGTVPEAALASSVFPAGHVIQTVTAMTTTQTNFGDGTTYVLCTDFAVSITPTYTDSKIVITFNSGIMTHGSTQGIIMKVTGTTTGEVMRQTQWGYSNDTNWRSFSGVVQAIDTPGSTSAQTYQLYLGTQVDIDASYARLNSEGNTNSGTIIAQEIKV